MLLQITKVLSVFVWGVCVCGGGGGTDHQLFLCGDNKDVYRDDITYSMLQQYLTIILCWKAKKSPTR